MTEEQISTARCAYLDLFGLIETLELGPEEPALQTLEDIKNILIKPNDPAFYEDIKNENP
uniref:Uncharacterized protein n=1 Tax=uncultured organism MedDCM-OCT-S11-C235 TaxID=743657 RepID=D6PLB9_9ZZZZ|nr:hypothetical protein [uncultured organism MedDCM-OCT-S11-C235]